MTQEENKASTSKPTPSDNYHGAGGASKAFVRSNSLIRGEMSDNNHETRTSLQQAKTSSSRNRKALSQLEADALDKRKAAGSSSKIDDRQAESQEDSFVKTRRKKTTGSPLSSKRRSGGGPSVPGAVSISPAQAGYAELEAEARKSGGAGKTPPRRKRGSAERATPGASSDNNDSTLRQAESSLGAKIRRIRGAPGALVASGTRRQRGKATPMQQGKATPMQQGKATPMQQGKATPMQLEPPKSQDLKDGAAFDLSGPSLPSPAIVSAGYDPTTTTQPETTPGLRDHAMGRRMPQADRSVRYAGTLYGAQDVEAANIEAVVAPVSALNVVAVPPEEIEQKEELSKFRRNVLIGVVCFVLVATAVIVPVVILFGPGSSDPSPVAMPSESPSASPSSAPTSDGFEQFLGLVANTYSTPESLLDPSSPQYQAALWVADEDELRDSIDMSRRLQRYFLACLYFATNGDESWTRCNRKDTACKNGEPWLVGTEDECQWRGLKCGDDDNDNNVTRIFFNIQVGETMGLKGQIPPEISYLTELTSLSFTRNQLTGTLPTFLGNLTNLENLRLGENQFHGAIPTQLQRLSLLTWLALDNNQLDGTIPAFVGEFEAMSKVELHANSLTGKIPPFLHVSSSLDVSSNQLTGFVEDGPAWDTDLLILRAGGNMLDNRTIWSQVTSMKGLASLRLEENQELGGPLPADLFSLTQLSFLDISSCSLTGKIPSGGISQLPSLARLILDDNELEGPIPLDDLESIVTSLRWVELHENNLTGEISETSVLCEYRGTSTRNISVLTVGFGVQCACCSDS